jgi:hypothetical protein
MVYACTSHCPDWNVVGDTTPAATGRRDHRRIRCGRYRTYARIRPGDPSAAGSAWPSRRAEQAYLSERTRFHVNGYRFHDGICTDARASRTTASCRPVRCVAPDRQHDSQARSTEALGVRCSWWRCWRRRRGGTLLCGLRGLIRLSDPVTTVRHLTIGASRPPGGPLSLTTGRALPD